MKTKINQRIPNPPNTTLIFCTSLLDLNPINFCAGVNSISNIIDSKIYNTFGGEIWQP